MLNFRPLDSIDRDEFFTASPDAKIATVKYMHFRISVVVDPDQRSAVAMIHNLSTGRDEGEYRGSYDMGIALTTPLSYDKWRGWEWTDYNISYTV